MNQQKRSLNCSNQNCKSCISHLLPFTMKMMGWRWDFSTLIQLQFSSLPLTFLPLGNPPFSLLSLRNRKKEMSKSYFWDLHQLKKDPRAKHFVATELKPGSLKLTLEQHLRGGDLVNLNGEQVLKQDLSSIFQNNTATLFVVSMQRTHCYEV
jgi:hypothetical protein